MKKEEFEELKKLIEGTQKKTETTQKSAYDLLYEKVEENNQMLKKLLSMVVE